MPILSPEMKRVIAEQRLAFVATVRPDGTPALSPKATLTPWDDDHLVFADVASPGTVENLRANPAIEINVVDPRVRKGWRFHGTAEVHDQGPRFEELRDFFEGRGVIDARRRIRGAVLVRVTRALPLISPVYALGVSEAEVRASWRGYWAALEEGRAPRGNEGEY